MEDQLGRPVPDKWAKQAALLANPSIAPHIPPTKRYSASNLRSMLNKHQMVVIKPLVGTGGHGVIKVMKTSGGFSFTSSSTTNHFTSFDALKSGLDKKRKGRPYLIQKGIRLAKVGGRPIDYRVKYVKTEAGWEYRSMVGRIAKPGLFVTNLCQGGTMVTAAAGIRRSLSASLVEVKKQQMRDLTVLSTSMLEERFPGIAQLGFDYGIDVNGKIWIFEVNTRPQ
ncbi:YheC/YheD family protein [Paenibacillus lupini]|uniref:YheC/YheD family protein n=1 Tax=Paenibacillus lupini TaxID=1450204 RepID=UPI001423E930|nr:YheC/YheD family protein [Paenibacillus lupini]NIK25178.1 glutathione synthase/RimK-type ligase-like ATP-grasp enzyme [Paenibacillus lupini]